jgi:hypothetical protein
MNWEEMQKLPPAQRRGLLGGEILAAIETGKLRGGLGYFDVSYERTSCTACAKGAAFVVKMGCEIKEILIAMHAQESECGSFESMSDNAMIEAGFTEDQCWQYEAIFENEDSIGKKWGLIRKWLHSGQFPTRTDRLKALWERSYRERGCELQLPIKRSEVFVIGSRSAENAFNRAFDLEQSPFYTYSTEDCAPVYDSIVNRVYTQYQYLIDDTKETTCKSQ